ncbi:MAG TPA: BON domain-containing protein [Steroidobacteraceae bacterium]|nr:BON domain-containing protein [Steroidobacteraceae bacterium]
MICASCGAEVAGAPKFCNKCGAPFTPATAEAAAATGATKLCPKCGAVNVVSAKFCKQDGYRFDSGQAAPQAPAPKPQAPPPPPRPAMPPPARPQSAAPAPSQAAIPGSVTCPTCGELNPPNARFCKKDGTSLAAAAAKQGKPADPAKPVDRVAEMAMGLSLAPDPDSEPDAAPRPPPRPMPPVSRPIETKPKIEIPKPAPPVDDTGIHATGVRRPPRSKAARIGLIAAVVVVAAGAAVLLYWKGIVGNRAEAVAENITTALDEKGFPGITVRVSPDWVATVSGIVVGQVKRDELLGIVQQDSNIKGVTDELTVRPGPGELEQQVGDALTARGFNTVTVTVGADLVAMLKGTVDDPSLETVAMDTARGVAGLKDVQSAIKLSIAARQAALTAALAASGFDQATAQIVDESTVNVGGNVYSADEKTKLVDLVSTTTGIATVNDLSQVIERPQVVNPGKVEADINNLLKKAGLANVAAVVDDKLNATLVGTVTRGSDRDKAMKTARKVTAIKSLRSEIEVAGAVVAAPVPQAPAESAALSAVKGQWSGKVDAGFLQVYNFKITINGGPLGQDVGTSIYGTDKSACLGTLTLQEANGQSFTFTESIPHAGMLCPGDGTLKMQVGADGKAKFEWYRKKAPTKRYAKGSGARS